MMGSVSIHHIVGGKPTIPCTIKAVWDTHLVVFGPLAVQQTTQLQTKRLAEALAG